jgi:hypothetical protein
MENVQAHFREKRDDLYSRWRLARTPEEKQSLIQDMHGFNLEARRDYANGNDIEIREFKLE